MLALKKAGVPAERVRAALQTLDVTLTLTAHPTEAARRTVLEKLYRIAKHLEERDRCHLTPDESARKLAEIREEITALWQTDEVRRESPHRRRRGEERRLVHRGDPLGPDPDLPTVIARAFEAAYGEPLDAEIAPLRIHSWVGADMDGNPLVVARRARGRAVRLPHPRAAPAHLGGARRSAARCRSRSGTSRRRPGCSPRSRRTPPRCPRSPRTSARAPRAEPWRRKLRFIEARLAATLERAEQRPRRGARARGGAPRARASRSCGPPRRATARARPYREPAELERDLAIVADSLRAAPLRALGRAARAGAAHRRCTRSGSRSRSSRSAPRRGRARRGGHRRRRTRRRARHADGARRAPRSSRRSQRIAAAQRDGGESSCRTRRAVDDAQRGRRPRGPRVREGLPACGTSRGRARASTSCRCSSRSARLNDSAEDPRGAARASRNTGRTSSPAACRR